MSQQARNNPEAFCRMPSNIPTLSDADREEQDRQAELAQVPDFWVLRAMIKFGGGFVKALAQAAVLADDNNLTRIKSAFRDYWQKYSEMALPMWKKNMEEPK
jgi:hypothetical protein